MPGYWWECETCGDALDFPEAAGASGITSFVWDKLLPTDWDQSLLGLPCKKCGDGKLRLTCESVREDKAIVRVAHIVGLLYRDHIAMMWETHSRASPSEQNFDFKYIRGRNSGELSAATGLSRRDLHVLFERYRQRTSISDFP